MLGMKSIPLFVVVGLLSLSTASAIDHTKDTLKTVKERVEEKKAVLVDVREVGEWDEGHVADAVAFPLSELSKADIEAIKKKIPKDRILYTYCAAGKRSLTAGEILKSHGFDVRPLKPGYKELIGAGFKNEKK